MTDADGTVGKALPYGVIWHVPYEWNTVKQEKAHWESATPITVRIPDATWQGHIEGNWKWKTVFAGEVPNAQDYYVDAAKEGWGDISDIFGINVEKSVDGAIDDVGDLRLRLLLKSGKKLAQIYGGNLYEQWFPGDQVGTASFHNMWVLNGSDALPNSNWVYDDGNKAPRPTIDWSLIGNDRPTDGALWDQQMQEVSNWRVKDPVMQIKKDRYLFRGDGYDSHGFTGAVYAGIDVYRPQPVITGTFTRPQPPAPPTPNPGGQ